MTVSVKIWHAAHWRHRRHLSRRRQRRSDELLRESVYVSLLSLSIFLFFLFVFYNSKVKAGCGVWVVNGHDAAVRVMSLPPVLLEHKVNEPGV